MEYTEEDVIKDLQSQVADYKDCLEAVLDEWQVGASIHNAEDVYQRAAKLVGWIK